MQMKNCKFISYLSLFLSGAGGLGISIEMIMSETVFPDINTFSSFPIWFQILMYVFIGMVVIGLILSAIYRNKSNTKQIELYIEGTMLVIGLAFMFVALVRNESKVKTIIVSIGVAIFGLAITTGISSLIGRLKSNRSDKQGS